MQTNAQLESKPRTDEAETHPCADLDLNWPERTEWLPEQITPTPPPSLTWLAAR